MKSIISEENLKFIYLTTITLIMNKITKEKLKLYFSITEQAFGKAKDSSEKIKIDGNTRADFIDMIERYLSDAKYFESKKDIINSFAAINYAHGWLDAGARIGLFNVRDSKLFTVDDD